MGSTLEANLDIPQTAGDWLFDFRRRDLCAWSPALALGVLGEDAQRMAAFRRRRRPVRDPLADCLAFAARWESPTPPADAPDSLDGILDPRN